MYKAGYFYMPTSGGPFSVGGLGFRPQGVMFFGGNVAAEDVLVTGGNPGVFFGMAWKTYQTNVIDQQANSNIKFGVNFQPYCINMAGTSGTAAEYQASMSSFDADGFTVNVTIPAPGSRLVHYLAYGDFEGANGATLYSLDTAIWDYPNLGYRPTTGLMFHCWVNSANRTVQHPDGVYHSMGVANWPFEISDNPPYGWQSSAHAIVQRVGTQLGRIGFTEQWVNRSTGVSPTISQTVRPWVAGSLLESYEHAYPYPTLESEALRVGLYGYPTRDSIAWWTGEGSAHHAPSVPDIGDTTTVTANENIDDIEAVLFFGTTGPSGGVLTPEVAFMLGVLTPDYQGCVGFDADANYVSQGQAGPGTPGFFQSRQLCYVDHVLAPGVRASSGEIVGNEVILTGEINDSPDDGNRSLMQIYGEQVELAQFFRVH